MRLMTGLIAAIGMLGLGTVAIAQQRGLTPLAATPAPKANPSLTGYARGVRDEANRRDFAVRQLDVQAELRGAIVEMTLDMQFSGRGEGTAEAWLHLDLPEGAVVTGYALDINGTLVDGVLIDQQKARETYERQVRRGIDPGIAEVSREGGLNVRVFPVDPVKGRHIRVRFVAPIASTLRLPLITAPGSGNWSINVRGIEQGATATLGGRPLARSGPLAVAAGTGRIDTMLVITPQAAPAIASRHPGTGETYWQLSGTLPTRLAPTGGTMRILWDRSRSMRDPDLAAVMPRLKEAVAVLQPSSIDFTAFNSGGATHRAVTPGDELTKAIREVDYAGASSLAPLAGGPPADNCILVSDGRQTVSAVADFAPPCRLFVIPAGKQADRATLADLAGRSGGQVIDGPGKADRWRQVGIDRVVDAGGKSLDFTSINAPGSGYHILVKNPDGGPLRLVSGGQSIDAAAPGPAAPFAGEGALIAARALTRVETAQGHDAFLALSRRYSVASPTLSFIVLEAPGDYVEAEIDPPANYPQMADYRAARAIADKAGSERKAQRFNVLLAAWQREVDWWEKKFDPYARPPQPPKPRPVSGRVNAPPPMVNGEPAPPPPPPPPPAAERDGPDDGDNVVDANANADSVVVTGSRVVRPDLEAPSPVTTVSAEQFDLTGTVTVESLLNDLPQVIPGNTRFTPGQTKAAMRAYERKVGAIPALYFDSSEWLWRQQRADEAVETLLSALELPDSNSQTMGIVAGRLQRWGRIDLAIQLREQQMAMEPNRPQPKRLLALALADRAKLGGPGARTDLERSIRLLVEIALSTFGTQWDGIDIIALREANALIPRLQAMGGTVDLDPRLVRNLTADIRVVIDWTVDDVDIDLWVDEPNGERAIYSHQRTTIGGQLSNDMTNGFGPEDYWLRVAPAGKFDIRTNNFRSDGIDPNGRPRLQVRLIRDFGRPTEREESIDYDAAASKNDDKKTNQPIGSITVTKPVPTKP